MDTLGRKIYYLLLFKQSWLLFLYQSLISFYKRYDGGVSILVLFIIALIFIILLSIVFLLFYQKYGMYNGISWKLSIILSSISFFLIFIGMFFVLSFIFIIGLSLLLITLIYILIRLIFQLFMRR